LKEFEEIGLLYCSDADQPGIRRIGNMLTLPFAWPYVDASVIEALATPLRVAFGEAPEPDDSPCRMLRCRDSRACACLFQADPLGHYASRPHRATVGLQDGGLAAHQVVGAKVTLLRFDHRHVLGAEHVQHRRFHLGGESRVVGADIMPAPNEIMGGGDSLRGKEMAAGDDDFFPGGIILHREPEQARRIPPLLVPRGADQLHVRPHLAHDRDDVVIFGNVQNSNPMIAELFDRLLVTAAPAIRFEQGVQELRMGEIEQIVHQQLVLPRTYM
jgi:hypothetical protein